MADCKSIMDWVLLPRSAVFFASTDEKTAASLCHAKKRYKSQNWAKHSLWPEAPTIYNLLVIDHVRLLHVHISNKVGFNFFWKIWRNETKSKVVVQKNAKLVGKLEQIWPVIEKERLKTQGKKNLIKVKWKINCN